MLRDFRKNKLFTRRAAMVSGVQISLFSVLVARLGYLQIFSHKEYSTKSDRNRIKPLIDPAPRGLIADRNSKALTDNIPNYRLFLYTENKSRIKNTVEKITQILNLSPQNQEIILSRIKNARRRSVISIIDSLSWDDVARIESNHHKLDGVSIESGTLRSYPDPFAIAHLVGYVSLPTQKDSSNQEQGLFLHPDFRIGKSGIERSFDEFLRGKFGIRYVEVNAFGTPIRNLSQKEATQGEELSLTIDLDLQKFTTKRLEGLTASAVVIDVKSGEILSMVSSPSFDPNKFVEGISQDYWQELRQNPRKPLNNKPISAIYPPGSTFKLMVTIAALESGFDPEKKVNCNGRYRYGNRTFHCWEKHGHGKLNMSDAIKHSCNIYFYDIAKELDIDKITEVAKRFGYGTAFDVSLFGVGSGNLPSNAWKKKVFHQPWVGGDTLNSAIGQGFVLATPLQLAVSTARLANGGIAINPHLVKPKKDLGKPEISQKTPIAKKEHIDFVLEGMRRVINEKGGTAYGKKVRTKGFEISGKTGTSQVVSKRESEMTDSQIEKHKNHAIFVGLAPVHDPKYAVSIVVEHGGGGSATAAPIGRDILLEVQKINLIP
ncbi:MAG: penicillin-binding protein 2 [Myxococcota bacterium]|jgi:penicillin-binding protein 2